MCTGLEIVKKDAIKDFKLLVADLQKQFGTDAVRNAVHGSTSLQNKKAESDLFFSAQNPSTAFLTNCTCAIIKPHVLKAG